MNMCVSVLARLLEPELDAVSRAEGLEELTILAREVLEGPLRVVDLVEQARAGADEPDRHLVVSPQFQIQGRSSIGHALLVDICLSRSRSRSSVAVDGRRSTMF
jgi:hypothetical protein